MGTQIGEQRPNLKVPALISVRVPFQTLSGSCRALRKGERWGRILVLFSQSIWVKERVLSS